MKKILLSILVLALSTLAAHADDRGLFGLKGQVVSSTVSRSGYSYSSYCSFSTAGDLKSLGIEGLEEHLSFDLGSDFKKTAKSIVGRGYTAAISDGKVRNVSYTDDDGKKWTVQYSYNADGQLAKITSSATWTTTSTERVNAQAAMNEAVKHANQLAAQLKKLKPGTPEYKKKEQEYNAAAKKAAINSTGSKTKTRTQAHSETGDKKEFSDYEYDEHGNWVVRWVSVNGGTPYKERQKVVYTPEFLCAYRWPLLEKAGDLDNIENFYNESYVTKAYKEKAQTYWNAHVKENVATTYQSNPNYLTHYASRSICLPELREEMMTVAREEIYKRNVLPETDFKRLRQLATSKEGDMAIFNKVYTDRIFARADSLFLQDVAAMQEQAAKKYEEKDFQSAIMLSTKGHELVADKDNYTSEVLSQAKIYGGQFTTLLNDAREALRLQLADEAYTALMGKKTDKSVKLADYDEFLKNHTNTKYIEEVTKLRAACYVRDNRGSFFHMGFGGDFSAGKGMYETTGGLGFLLGWRHSIVNFYTGVQFGGFTGFGTLLNKGLLKLEDEYAPDINEDAKVPRDGGCFSGQHFVIPAVLRINFARSFTSAGYIGVGANLNVAFRGHLGRTLREENGYGDLVPAAYDHVDDCDLEEGKSFYKKSFYITPRVGIGYTSKGFELELYGLYELGSVINKDLVDEYREAAGDYFLYDDKKIEKQLGHRFRIGASMRFIF